MKKIIGILGLILLALVLFAYLAGRHLQAPSNPERVGEVGAEAVGVHKSLLYGRVTTVDGHEYEGRLRWGGGEEAFWGDDFNGYKELNPWAALAPPERIFERSSITILGFEIAERKRPIELGRPFMARFGDIVRLEADGPELRVELKSGTVHLLDRYEADDLADGIRIWERTQGRVVDLDERQIRRVEFLETPLSGEAPDRLYGTVRTGRGEFTGFLQWGREKSLGTDTLDGRGSEGELRLPFSSIRSIRKSSASRGVVTSREGQRVELSGSLSRGRRGIYVEDRRFGKVLVSWEAFESVEFRSSPESGPGYGDFLPGQPLRGHVTTRDGRRYSGRLVYDLDESESSETLDAPVDGVNYTIPFGLIASIELPADDGAHIRVVLNSTLLEGTALELERSGDLSDQNVGLLVFREDRESAELVPWEEVRRIEFERLKHVES